MQDKAPEEVTRGHEGTAEDRLCDSSDAKGREHKEAYVRVRALSAAIVRIVRRQDME